jgi:Lon protease-like protein
MVDGYTLGLAKANGQAAESWQNYARQLEQQLATEKASNAAARALAKALSDELVRVAPTSPLAKKENRTRIFNEAYDKA